MVMFIMNYYIHIIYIYLHLHVGPSSMLVHKLNTWMNRLSALQGAAAEEALTSAIANGTDFDWARKPDKTYQPRTWFRENLQGLHVKTMRSCGCSCFIYMSKPCMVV